MAHPRKRRSAAAVRRTAKRPAAQGQGTQHRAAQHSAAQNSAAQTPESQCLTLEIDNLTSDAQGVARRGRDVYFVPGALPGETVEVLLDGRRKKVWQTRLRQVLTPSDQRRDAGCPHYRQCGGCDMQHMSSEAQLEAKQQRSQREFQRQGIAVEQWQEPIVGEPWHYRRKARLGVRFSKAEQRNYIGFREAASSHISDIDHCPVLVQHPVLDWAAWRELISGLQGRDAISQIEVIAADNALALVLRQLKPLSARDQQQLCDFVERYQQDAQPLQLWLKDEQHSQCIFPQHPPAPLWHEVQGLRLNMALDDFIQVNAGVNQAMVAQALAWLQVTENDCIWDLFAGHGNFSMPLARLSQQVLAVEVQPAMVASIQRQAEKLALPLLAKQADLSEAGCLQALPEPQAVLLDPPRAGAAQVCEELIRRQVPRIVYVSCDVATLARDLASLTAAGYTVVKAGIMDMFPQTHHVETMVLLQYKSKNRHG